MSLSSKSSSSDSVSSGPEDDAENDSSDSKSLCNTDLEDVESEGSIDGSSEGEEECVNADAKINAKKRKRQEAEEESTEEDKVLSHAEKRRQRKREQQKLKAQPAAESRPQKRKKSSEADVSAANSNTKRQNSIWVGNLSYKTTVNDLKAFFAEAGETTRINMPTKVLSGARKPENRGYAPHLLLTRQPTRPALHALGSLMSILRPQKPKPGRLPCLSSTSSAANYS
jgi:hypothetical protein